ncbi:hypothetical protein BKA62DRAFT_709752 [Auriculariales sp. MPI-PUGE-AT-0066]|nr:hypothetical protein BKA62DRAFT_709752 [Auriculariales sp. MPI-PUGE-AT-0066]
MPRVRVLRLRGVHVPSVAAASKRKVFWTFPAPVLERLAISWATSSPQQEPLAAPPLLFQGYAPCLVDVELEVPPGQEMVLPPHCAAFANVSTLRLRASALRGSPSARFFHDQFPNLRSLSLGTTKGVGNTFKSGNTWTGTRVLEYLELQEEDNRAETQNSIVIIQMFAQDPDAIDCIHVRRGSLSLVTFIWRRFAQNSSSSRLFVFGAHHVNNRCVVSITDVKGRCRIISEMHPSAISSTLAAKKGATLSPFTELVLWQATSTEYLAQVATQHLPRLHKLIIFVRSSAKYGVGASQDILATRLPWQVPALRVLRFTSMDISGADLFPQPARNPSVSARAVAGFVRSLPVELDRLELERVGLVDGDLMSLTSLANEVVIL